MPVQPNNNLYIHHHARRRSARGERSGEVGELVLEVTHLESHVSANPLQTSGLEVLTQEPRPAELPLVALAACALLPELPGAVLSAHLLLDCRIHDD